MKQVYGKFSKLRRNEAFLAFAITLLSVAAYSFWGAHLLAIEDSSPQVVSVSR